MKKWIIKCPHCKWRVPKTWYCVNCGKLIKAVRTTADYDRLDMSKSQRKRKARKKKLEKRNESGR